VLRKKEQRESIE